MLIVKKFGGSSVADRERIFNVAERCVEEYKKGNDVIVVLSAMGDTTDELIAKAKEINPNASRREMDMLLTTGEQVSVSLMAMAISSMGIPAVSLNAFQVGMHCTSAYGNARFKRVDADRIRHELEYRKIVIITGFQGVSSIIIKTNVHFSIIISPHIRIPIQSSTKIDISRNTITMIYLIEFSYRRKGFEKSITHSLLILVMQHIVI